VFVTQTTRTHPFGLAGAGSIRNIGANDLEVRETATGLNGVTDNVTSVVGAGAVAPLSLIGMIGNASPPYTSYSVEVRDLGAATTFRLTLVSNAEN
jgi:hypothetical protein